MTIELPDLSERDVHMFCETLIGFPAERRMEGITRCHAALQGGFISARKFARAVESDLDTIADHFEALGFERPYQL